MTMTMANWREIATRAPAPCSSTNEKDIARRLAFGVGVYLIALFVMVCGLCRFAPDQLSFAVFGHGHVLHDLHRHLYFKFIVLTLVIPALLLVEIGSTGWRDSSLRRLLLARSPSSRSDVVCFLIDQTPIMTALTFVASLGVLVVSAAYMHGLIERFTGINPTLDWAPLPGQFLIYFLVYSFFDYWGHRLDHSRWFWPLHRFHHAMDEFYIVGSVRVHPAAFTRLFQQALPAALVGASPSMIMELNFSMVVFHFMIHSRIASNFGLIGRYLLQSPTHHRLHHSLEAGADSGHFGVVPFWDHLFGTWRGEADHSLPIGVDTPYRHGAWIGPDLWRDYCEFWGGLRSVVSPRGRTPAADLVPMAGE
jgi:sterol desaturase/sphingolipid hydroxylase (fatty acid hydroxylase superfamily)